MFITLYIFSHITHLISTPIIQTYVPYEALMCTVHTYMYNTCIDEPCKYKKNLKKNFLLNKIWKKETSFVDSAQHIITF